MMRLWHTHLLRDARRNKKTYRVTVHHRDKKTRGSGQKTDCNTTNSDDPPRTLACIVNEAGTDDPSGICGRPIPLSKDYSGPPVCSRHLCGYRSPETGVRCCRRPEKVVYGSIDRNGLFFANEESANCARHESQNCEAKINDDGDRCPEQKDAKSNLFCDTHLAMACKSWEGCGEFALEEASFCRWHLCNAMIEPGSRCQREVSVDQSYCSDHRCKWENHLVRRCSNYADTGEGVCKWHICGWPWGCSLAARHCTTFCWRHVCRYGSGEGGFVEYPECLRPARTENGFCTFHSAGIPSRTAGIRRVRFGDEIDISGMGLDAAVEWYRRRLARGGRPWW
ncbi:hypothetical protein QBC35DRAFT_292635 [Podospora australis]|uniref:Uncharacterized protein n=1 Tax=Podospora australis TaxID=1536484 RepID=A0AAN6X3U5_9PEZI|nr:hypothetical protein QBC35DRAFT_292635 [Podospora australis]